MSEGLQTIIAQVQQLSAADKAVLRSYLLTEEAREKPPEKPKAPSKRPAGLDMIRAGEREWMAAHGDEYAGQWVALDGNRLIAHGFDGREVYRQADASGVKYPFVVHLPKADALPFGGW